MKGGFSFCGIDIADLDLEYVPDLKNTYIYRPSQANIDEIVFNGHDGGYFFGRSLKPKDFSLRCYFEEKDIRYGIYSYVHEAFKVGRTGKLIFKNRPWCWYTGTVISVDDSALLNRRNGFITINIRAYYPFARCDFYSSDDYTEDVVSLENNSAMLHSSFNTPVGYSSDNITEPTSILLYNPGTVDCPVSISFAGNVGEGLILENLTTKQIVKFVGVSKAVTSYAGKHILCDSMNGKTVIVNENNGETENAFAYHDIGFMCLKSSFPVIRSFTIELESGSDIVHTKKTINEDCVGKYVFIDGTWNKIIEYIDNNSFKIKEASHIYGTAYSCMAVMNEINIYPVSDSGIELTKLNIDYKPTFN